MGHAVLVIGAARYLGAALVRALVDEPGVAKVVGADTAAPRAALPEVDFVRAGPGDPAIARLLAAERIDTVVHAGLVATPAFGGGRAAMKELNVIGTMQLLAVCQRAVSVRRVVLVSSTAGYGASSQTPGLLHEDDQPRAGSLGPFGKDVCEAEGYLRGFARRRPDAAVMVLRYADVLGAEADTPFGRYLALPVLPSVLGYDPRLQCLHADDAVEVLRQAALGEWSGTYNVAGDGVLLASQIARRLGRPTVRIARPVLSTFATALRRAGLADLTADQLKLLTHGRAVDTTRLREDVGYIPAWTTAEAVADFALAKGFHGPLAADRLAAAERAVRTLPDGLSSGLSGIRSGALPRKLISGVVDVLSRRGERGGADPSCMRGSVG